MRRDFSQQVNQLLALGRVKRGEEGIGRPGERSRRPPLHLLAAVGQVDQEGPAVPRCREAGLRAGIRGATRGLISYRCPP